MGLADLVIELVLDVVPRAAGDFPSRPRARAEATELKGKGNLKAKHEPSVAVGLHERHGTG